MPASNHLFSSFAPASLFSLAGKTALITGGAARATTGAQHGRLCHQRHGSHRSGLAEEYKKLSPATVARHGGRFLARGGRIEALEGDWLPKRLVILEFPSVEQARAWVESSDYAPARQLRQRASRSRLIVVEGVSAG